MGMTIVSVIVELELIEKQKGWVRPEGSVWGWPAGVLIIAGQGGAEVLA